MEQKKRDNDLYGGKHGNLIVEHTESMAICPIANYNHTEHSDRDILSKLCSHIASVHNLSYTTGPVSPSANQY